MTNLVAVYGTLKKHHSNHYLLREAEFQGTCRLQGLDMYSLAAVPLDVYSSAAFPAVISGEGSIEAEVYEVNSEQLAQIDKLEGYESVGHPYNMYDREKRLTPWGDAYIYVWANPEELIGSASLVKDGSWPLRSRWGCLGSM